MAFGGVMRLLLLAVTLALGLPVPARAQVDDVAAAARSVVRVVAVAAIEDEVVGFGHGSGFAISPTRVVTNAHVVEEAARYPGNVFLGVVPSEGSRGYNARLVAVDPARDLALIELVEGRLPPATLYMGPIADGTHVVALGYPGNVDLATARSADDYITPLPPTRSEGNFSNLRSIDGIETLLHTAAIARGNSGGPLLDGCGRIIGVNTFITRAEEGDANFGFAISNRELAAFLRSANQQAQTVSSECVSMESRLREERDRLAEAARAQAADAAGQQASAARKFAAERDRIEAARENRIAIALVLFVFGALATGAGGIFLSREDRRRAMIAGGAGGILMLAALGVFLTRPGPEDIAITEDRPASAKPRYDAVGSNICIIQPERSRVTVSDTSDVSLDWKADGCVNGRTQYTAEGGRWSRILVPDTEATISLAEFDPVSGEYLVSRYLMPAEAMAEVRALRRNAPRGLCTADAAQRAQLGENQRAIRAMLPPAPNERLVFRCQKAGAPVGG